VGEDLEFEEFEWTVAAPVKRSERPLPVLDALPVCVELTRRHYDMASTQALSRERGRRRFFRNVARRCAPHIPALTMTVLKIDHGIKLHGLVCDLDRLGIVDYVSHLGIAFGGKKMLHAKIADDHNVLASQRLF